jgi:hypothetical protein
MPVRLRLDAYRSIEIAFNRLSPRYGCGQMLAGLSEIDTPDPLVNAMSNYGFGRLAADKPARKLLENPGLLKPFYDNTFSHRLALKQNFRQTFGHVELLLAFDTSARNAWFVSDPTNRMALSNYFRDAVSLSLKSSGVLLLGSTVKLTPAGWQNLHDLLPDKFVNSHKGLQRVEVMGIFSGTRWRQGCLSIGASILNFRELAELQPLVEEAYAGGGGGEVEV